MHKSNRSSKYSDLQLSFERKCVIKTTAGKLLGFKFTKCFNDGLESDLHHDLYYVDGYISNHLQVIAI